MTIASTASTKVTAAQPLDLTEELILVLLSEESGYFHQVPGWHLNCAMAGAALAELSLQARIDTDMESLILLDKTPTGKPILDLALQQIASEPDQRSAQYWVERLAPRAEMMLDLALEQLVRLGILEHHDGEFWSLTAAARHSDFFAGDDDDTAAQFIKTRIGRSILLGEIPSPRDVIIIGLAHTCDVLRFIFELDDEAEERVQLICQMDLIGRAIADAVAHNLVASLLRSSALTKSVPKLPLNKLLLNRHFLRGNIPAGLCTIDRRIRSSLQAQPLVLRAGDHVPIRPPRQSLGSPSRSHAPQVERLSPRSRDCVSRLRAAACAGWRRSFPHAQVAACWLRPRAIRTAARNGISTCSNVYQQVECRGHIWSRIDVSRLLRRSGHAVSREHRGR